MKYKTILLSIALTVSTFPARAETTGFIFDAQSVHHSSKPNLTLRIGEKISRDALKKRFAGYKVEYRKGDVDCYACADIIGSDVSLFVSFAEDGRTVQNIDSTDSKSIDTFGNKIGGSLQKALGTTANCQEGIRCDSSSLNGLRYYADYKDSCSIKLSEPYGSQIADIPACATIRSFSITQPEQPKSNSNELMKFMCGREPLILDFDRHVLTFKGTEYNGLEAIEEPSGYGEWQAGPVNVGMNNRGNGGIEIKSKSGTTKYDCRLAE